jgi:hypothetical protein
VKRRIWLVLAAALCGLAQDTPQKKDDTKKDDPPKKEEPAPVFGGKLGTRSSQRTKENASLGFNGIDPSGKVDAKMLATSPGPADQAKVQEMAKAQPSPAELQAFLKEGGLNKK